MGRNGILCGIVDQETGNAMADFQKVDTCGMYEWCTGPSTLNQSIQTVHDFGKHSLCTIGNYSPDSMLFGQIID